jgi:excisionase family DNA binding protein
MNDSPFTTPPATPAPLALRPREAARALGLSERTLWSLTKAGAIPCVHVGRMVLYPVDALRNWLAESAAKVTP